MNFSFLPQNLAIKAMRDSGYKDSAHALAELIDNSIEAGHKLKRQTNVEVIGVDSIVYGNRKSSKIDQIAVYDDACGMDSETLRAALAFGRGTHLEAENQYGIGKFGMGLPNSSISQCRRLEVYTWQNGKCIYSYLDIDEIHKIEQGGDQALVPEPQKKEIPETWKNLIKSEITSSGTLVVWSKLDRVFCKKSKTLLDRSAFIIGRMYRNFLNNSVKIRLAAYADSASANFDTYVKPVDPLYLMTDTNTPNPFDTEAAFVFVKGTPLTIEYIDANGQIDEHKLNIRFSVCKKEARDLGGSSKLGKHCAKNQGISLVRADREIGFDFSFNIGYDPRDRWWGCEVRFGPDLDHIFGVTNNKQGATNFRKMDIEYDAENEEMTQEEYRDYLKETGDHRLALYKISKEIQDTLRILMEQIKRFQEGTRSKGESIPGAGSAEDIARKKTEERRERLATYGKSDEDEGKTANERQREIEDTLVKEGIPEHEAKKLSREISVKGPSVKYVFQETELPGSYFFDVKSAGGVIFININKRHPASDHFYDLLKNNEDDGADPIPLKGLKLLLTSWARLEDESAGKRLEALEDIRVDWGIIAREFIKGLED